MREFLSSILFLMAVVGVQASDGKYTIKQTNTPAPNEVHESIRKLLVPNSLQVRDEQGNQLCEIWLRKEIPVKATPEQVKNGLSYREIEESTVLGVIKYDQQASDYRKQKIKPGTYTIRLGFQPMDGDHMGTAPHTEFGLLSPVAVDQKPDPMEAKELRELSAKTTGTSHPAVLLLFPNEKPEAAPKMVSKPNEAWALAFKQGISVDGKAAPEGMGFALTVVGHTTAE